MGKYAGYVDGIFQGEIHGWIADLNDADQLLKIVITSDVGVTISVRPANFRPDVLAHLGRGGLGKMYGFAVPLAALPRHSRKVIISDPEGNQLPNGEVAVDPDYWASQAARNPCLIFIHIQKTAGTVLRDAVSAAFPSGERCFIYPNAPFAHSMDEFFRLTAAQRTHLKLIMGHFHFGVDRYLMQGCRYATFLRDPIERVKSNYWHHRGRTDHFKIGGKKVPLHVVMNEGLTDEFDNLQTRYIAGLSSAETPYGKMGEDDVSLARYHIQEKFDFIGAIESLDHYAKTLSQILGRNLPPIERKYVRVASLGDENDESYKLIDWERVKRLHEPDLALYDYVLKHADELNLNTLAKRRLMRGQAKDAV